MIPVLDPELCTGCGECVEVCPSQAITVSDGKAVLSERFCEECGDCVDKCPEKAFSLPRARSA